MHDSGQAGTVATDTTQRLLDFPPGGLTLCRAFESGATPPEVHPGPKQRDVFFILLRGSAKPLTNLQTIPVNDQSWLGSGLALRVNPDALENVEQFVT
ncbi:hypothetical protein p1B334 (plasmid) [Aromatoleum aromaticum EbN1]|uniref:Uncharacterized protein n=1 Tax=Aromatoleum aromaticum (strain DSM 19018 / LMG 30748 / EbN1) TaxID=76114 RepID=Q5NWR5_AROAE|nr:hypothetical protein p1B334 [Aromatoleum aromaticum EbN1]